MNRFINRGGISTLITAGAIAIASMGLVACGSDATTSASAPDRQASARPNADGVCPERTSVTIRTRVRNSLPSPVTFTVPINSIDCADWSGVSTPYTAFNKLSIPSGHERTLRLEPAKYADSSVWTMGMRSIGTRGVAEGTSRVYTRHNWTGVVGGPRPQLTTWECGFAPVATAPPGWRDTSEAYRFDRDSIGNRIRNNFIVGVLDGKVGYFLCVGGINPGDAEPS